MGKKKEYTNGEITIVWEPDKCFHSGNCVRGLPEVFKPKERPWINMDSSNTNSIIETVKSCPSGALTFYRNDKPKSLEMSDKTKIEVVSNGPLLIHGTCTVNTPDGNSEEKENVTAFCRCGASENKPYCDGKHRQISFEG